MSSALKTKAAKACWIAVAVGIFSLANSTMASAHPPKEVIIGYDLAQQTLSVTISHKTTFTSTHYIKTVEIMKNGAVVATEEYTNQPKEKPFIYTYQIPAEAGDEIEVKATCKIFGSGEAKITVQAAQ